MKIGHVFVRGGGVSVSSSDNPDEAPVMGVAPKPQAGPSAEEKQRAAGLLLAEDPGISWDAAQAKAQRLEGRLQEARAELTAAEGELAALRAERVASELEERSGPSPAGIAEGEARVRRAEALVADRQEVLARFRPTLLGAEVFALDQEDRELGQRAGEHQQRINALEGEIARLNAELALEAAAIRGFSDQQAALRARRAAAAQELRGLRRAGGPPEAA